MFEMIRKRITESTATEETQEERSRRKNKYKGDRRSFNKSFDELYSDIFRTTSKKDKKKKKEEVIIKREYKEIDYTLDGSVKQLFLNLTKMQITFGKEETLEEFFPEGMKKDQHGNYFIKIGDSKTMFCGHLDTYSRQYARVYHIIEGNIIMTNGTTTLGGDDKAGIVIMLKMIEAGVPGLYYFFRGEEGVTSPTGTWGSKQALATYKDIFSTYEKCVAFDRRGFKSIISQQMYSECCSNEFVKALEEEFKKNGMDYEEDKTGMWCDSGVFMETIPECTNISVGYKSEHTFNETQDIEHLEKLVKAAIGINWESLPVKRDPTKVTKKVGRYNYDDYYGWDYSYNYYRKSGSSTNYNPWKQTYVEPKVKAPVKDQDIFDSIVELLAVLGYECVNPEDFIEAEEMFFQNIAEKDYFILKIIDKDVYMTETEDMNLFTNYGNFEDFKNYIINLMGDESDIFDDYLKKIDKVNVPTPPTHVNKPELKVDMYEKIVKAHPELTKEIIKDTVKHFSLHNIVNVDGKLWSQIDDIMREEFKLPMDYSGSRGGYNPDDFVDWIYDHKHILDTVVTEKDKNKFINNIELSDYYSDRQDEIFSEIVDKEKELVRMVLSDIDIMGTVKVREKTENRIEETIKHLGYEKELQEGHKRINAHEFILWVYDYTDEINKFYNK